MMTIKMSVNKATILKSQLGSTELEDLLSERSKDTYRLYFTNNNMNNSYNKTNNINVRLNISNMVLTSSNLMVLYFTLVKNLLWVTTLYFKHNV